jgi:hypothetical protein
VKASFCDRLGDELARSQGSAKRSFKVCGAEMSSEPSSVEMVACCYEEMTITNVVQKVVRVPRLVVNSDSRCTLAVASNVAVAVRAEIGSAGSSLLCKHSLHAGIPGR